MNGDWGMAPFFGLLFLVALVKAAETGRSCGPSDQACAARLRAASFHADAFRNLYPPP